MLEEHSKGDYYLPAAYDDDRIVLLPRDPHVLYAYWEISSKKMDDFSQSFGNHLWGNSCAVLKITNVSKNISFFVYINDYTNNWYINVDDAGSLYIAQIGRMVTNLFFIDLASSNYVVTPSETISTNCNAYFVNYKDLKHDRFDINSANIIKEYNYKFQKNITFGLSSPELYGINIEQSSIGVSSTEIFGKG